MESADLVEDAGWPSSVFRQEQSTTVPHRPLSSTWKTMTRTSSAGSSTRGNRPLIVARSSSWSSASPSRSVGHKSLSANTATTATVTTQGSNSLQSSSREQSHDSRPRTTNSQMRVLWQQSSPHHESEEEDLDISTPQTRRVWSHSTYSSSPSTLLAVSPTPRTPNYPQDTMVAVVSPYSLQKDMSLMTQHDSHTDASSSSKIKEVLDTTAVNTTASIDSFVILDDSFCGDNNPAEESFEDPYLITKNDLWERRQPAQSSVGRRQLSPTQRKSPIPTSPRITTKTTPTKTDPLPSAPTLMEILQSQHTTTGIPTKKISNNIATDHKAHSPQTVSTESSFPQPSDGVSFLEDAFFYEYHPNSHDTTVTTVTTSSKNDEQDEYGFPKALSVPQTPAVALARQQQEQCQEIKQPESSFHPVLAQQESLTLMDVSKSFLSSSPVKSPNRADTSLLLRQRQRRLSELERHTQELEHWDRIVRQRLETYGLQSTETAHAYICLGNSCMNLHKYVDAQQAFQSAYRIFRHRNKVLGVALAMERMGVATSLDAYNAKDGRAALQRAYTVLLEAFRIRQEQLGSHHVDTVDCLNQIAKVHVQANDLVEAQRCYWQVFWVRKAIFGAHHPSIAVAAHDLANVFYKRGSKDDANNFYQIALEVYDNMELPNENPAVARLLKDMKRLDRVDLLQSLPGKDRQSPTEADMSVAASTGVDDGLRFL